MGIEDLLQKLILVYDDKIVIGDNEIEGNYDKVFSANGKVFLGSDNSLIDASNMNKISLSNPVNGMDEKDGTIYTIHKDGTMNLFEDGISIKQIDITNDSLTAICADENVLLGDENGKLFIVKDKYAQSRTIGNKPITQILQYGSLHLINSDYVYIMKNISEILKLNIKADCLAVKNGLYVTQFFERYQSFSSDGKIDDFYHHGELVGIVDKKIIMFDKGKIFAYDILKQSPQLIMEDSELKNCLTNTNF